MYGIKYKNNAPVSHLEPTKLARPDWEACASVTNRLKLDVSTGKYIIVPFPGGDLPVTTMDNPLACPGEESWWEELGEFFGDAFDWIGDLFDAGGGGGDAPGRDGDGWGPGGYTGGSSWDWGNAPQIGDGASGYGGGGWHGPNPGNLEEGEESPIHEGGTRAQGNTYVDPTILKKILIKNRLNAIKGAFDEWSFQDIPANSPHMTAREFQDMVTGTETIDPPNVFNAAPDKKRYHFHTWGAPWSGYDFWVNLKLNAGIWEFESANSALWGATPGVDWQQTETPNFVTANLITVDIEGYLVYSIFIDGIGVMWRSFHSYRWNGNRLTGAHISFDRID